MSAVGVLSSPSRAAASEKESSSNVKCFEIFMEWFQVRPSFTTDPYWPRLRVFVDSQCESLTANISGRAFPGPRSCQTIPVGQLLE